MRVDKFLWCIRACKSRTQSAELCSAGRITVNGKSVKASREVKPGDKISLRLGPVTFSYDVLECPKSRVAASMVNAFARDVTTAAELEKLNKIREIRANNTLRLPGRPTKRDRRDLEEFLDEQWSDES